MINVDIVVDTSAEYWDVKDKLQKEEKDIYIKELILFNKEDSTTHIFVPRLLDKGKYVYYETKKEEINSWHMNSTYLEV